MPVINPPGYLHNVATHTAQVDRLAAIASGMAPDGAGLTWRGGVRGLNDLKVVQRAAGANMSVDVGAGLAFVKGTSNSFQGLYSVPNDGAVNVSITAAHATLGRRDLIIARVQDAFYAGSLNTATIEVVTGTAAASPVDPALPASSLLLARVTVNAAATSITNANITDFRTWTAALGGVITCLSTARPSATLAAGMEIYESDTGRKLISDGTNWVQHGGHGAWISFTPTYTNIGSPTTNYAKYYQVGKLVRVLFKFTLNGAPTSTMRMAVPLTAAADAPVDELMCSVGVISGLRQGLTIRNGLINLATVNDITFRQDNDAAPWRNGAPQAWAATDIFSGSYAYPAA